MQLSSKKMNFKLKCVEWQDIVYPNKLHLHGNLLLHNYIQFFICTKDKKKFTLFAKALMQICGVICVHEKSMTSMKCEVRPLQSLTLIIIFYSDWQHHRHPQQSSTSDEQITRSMITFRYLQQAALLKLVGVQDSSSRLYNLAHILNLIT